MPNMRVPRTFAAALLVSVAGLLQSTTAQSASAGAASTAASDGLSSHPIANPAVPAAPGPAASGSTVSAVAAAPVSIAPGAAVKSILTMFTLNPSVNVEAAGKPLPATGSWGAQTQFPGGPPKPCVEARVPCVRVIYRVPEMNVVCEWILGLLVVVAPQADGTMGHATRSIVLDENEAAARYTLRKAWAHGEAMPHPTKVQNPEYPKIAIDASVGGVVAVRLVVGPDGAVKSVVPLAGPPMLQVPVLEAVRHWKFDPLSIGGQPTSFQLDEQFSYKAPRANTFAGMDPSGHVVIPQTDPHEEPGFRTDGVSSGQWSSCSAVTCAAAAPDVPPTE